MFEFLRTYQLSIMFSLSLAAIIFVILLLLTKSMNKKSKMLLIFSELSVSILLIFERFAYIFRGDVSSLGYVMVRVSNFVVFFMILVIAMLFNHYLQSYVRADIDGENIPKRFIIVDIIAVIGMLLIVISQFTNMYYYFDEMNRYQRGPAFIVCYMIPLVCLFIQLSLVLQYRNRFSSHIRAAFIIYFVLPIIASVVQFFAYGLSLTNMSIAIAILTLYIFAYLDLNDEVEKMHQVEMGQLEEERNSMKRLFDQTATAFVSAVEKKDESIQGHSKAVADIARRIAKASGEDKEECERVYYAALLHDIGTVELPDRLIGKSENLTDEDKRIIRNKPIDSAQILSNITEFPYLKEAVMYHKERYDGTGYPNGLKGEDIPWMSRVISISDAYASMSTRLRNTRILPYQKIREELVEGSGAKFDPKYAEIMISILDEDYKESAEAENVEIEESINCEEYRDKVSVGISITDVIKKVKFEYIATNNEENGFSSPSIILFDSYDRRIHKTNKSIDVYKYIEFGELFFDGHFVSTAARNIEVKVSDKAQDVEKTSKSQNAKGRYNITMSRYEDHISIIMEDATREIEYIVALPDKTKKAFLGITGEHCDITNIEVEETEDKVNKDSIRRIVAEESYIDRLESDIPNTQVDGPRYAHTMGVKVKNSLYVDFHTMSLPSASLAWHCPYILVYSSSDGKVGGTDYKEYALVKINGECGADNEYAQNDFHMRKSDEFPGWEAWKTTNKRGKECSVEIIRKSNKIMLHTENLGIIIDDNINLLDDRGDVYMALTGDQVALTDIRIRED